MADMLMSNITDNTVNFSVTLKKTDDTENKELDRLEQVTEKGEENDN
jgi:hypothetical protein